MTPQQEAWKVFDYTPAGIRSTREVPVKPPSVRLTVWLFRIQGDVAGIMLYVPTRLPEAFTS